MTPSEEMTPRQLRFKLATHVRTADWPTHFSNLAVGIGLLRIAENWAVFKKMTRFRGSSFGYHNQTAPPAIPRFPTYSFLPKVETFFVPGKLFVVQAFCLLRLMLATVFNCATWWAPWIWMVCFTQSFEIELVVRRTA